MDRRVAGELIQKLAESPIIMEPKTESMLRYAEVGTVGLSISSTDILSLFELGPTPRPIASIRMLDPEYNLQDALCLAYHRIPGKDLFEYLA